jgi:hypothetical protein
MTVTDAHVESTIQAMQSIMEGKEHPKKKIALITGLLYSASLGFDSGAWSTEQYTHLENEYHSLIQLYVHIE